MHFIWNTTSMWNIRVFPEQKFIYRHMRRGQGPSDQRTSQKDNKPKIG